MGTTKALLHGNKRVDRRAVLAALTAVPFLGACGTFRSGEAAAGNRPNATPDADQSSRHREQWARLEQQYGSRLGLSAVNTATGRRIGHREHERFALCSTFKTYAAGGLLKAHPLSSGYFDELIHYTRADLVEYSPVTETRVDTGMTVSELCHAAITRSDNTAGNLLLKLQGGPSAIAPFARSIGDTATRLDRWETELNSALRGDERDTTTPAAISTGYGALVVGNALPAAETEQLKAWLVANTTGGERIRAGLPPEWITGDKTGTGDYGTNNNVAITWTDKNEPLVIAALSDKTTPDAEPDNALIADAAKIVADALR